jgi:hypothetical protein
MPVPVHVRAHVGVHVRGFCANNERSRGRIRQRATNTSSLGCPPRAGAKAGVFSCYCPDPSGRGGGEEVEGERKIEREKENVCVYACERVCVCARACVCVENVH